ncbi:MAG: hypothetical protein GY716_23825 [bacterium]|nr:hypothetical protein [bacterium]
MSKKPPAKLIRAEEALGRYALSFPETVEEWIDESYRAIAPKRLVATL